MGEIEFSKIGAFLDWTKRKIGIHYAGQPLYFHEQEIWWASIGENIGSEENGKNHLFERPVLIVRKFNKELFWGIPISSTIKDEKWYYGFTFHGRAHSSLLTQLRAMSGRRLLRRIGRMSDHDFEAVQARLKELMFTKKTDPPAAARGSSEPLSRTL